MGGYIELHDGLFVAIGSIESFRLSYREIRGRDRLYTIEIVFKSGYTTKFEDVSEAVYNSIVKKLHSV